MTPTPEPPIRLTEMQGPPVELGGHLALLTRLAWGSILAGALVALALHLLLAMLAVSLGVDWFAPLAEPRPSGPMTAAAGLAWAVSTAAAFWCGGWIAGRSAGYGSGNVGGLHGVVAWAVASVGTFFFVGGTPGLLPAAGVRAASWSALEAATAPTSAQRVAASWTFLVMAVAAFFAAWGGRHGALRAMTFHRWD